MDLTFNTKIEAKEITIDDRSVVAHVHIKWSAHLEANDSALKGISARVQDQDITIRVEEEIDEEGDTQEKEEVISLKDVEVLYERDPNHDLSETRSLGLMPFKLEIYKGKVSVTFVTYSV